MNKLAIRLLTLALLSLTLAAAPVVTAVYAAPDNDPPPPDKKKPLASTLGAENAGRHCGARLDRQNRRAEPA